MNSVDRRTFLRKGSLTILGAGALVAVPGLSSAQVRAPAVDTAAASGAALPEGASLETPLVAHVKDLATGEIGVYFGTNEVTFTDPHLAARLFRVTQ